MTAQPPGPADPPHEGMGVENVLFHLGLFDERRTFDLLRESSARLAPTLMELGVRLRNGEPCKPPRDGLASFLRWSGDDLGSQNGNDFTRHASPFHPRLSPHRPKQGG